MAVETIDKPELVVFSENVVGGVQSYYYSLLQNDEGNTFSKTWILTDNYFNDNARPQKPFDTGFEKIFQYRSDNPQFHVLKALERLVSNLPGIVLVSFPLDLAVMHVYRKKYKTIGFVCHDEYFLQFAVQYDFLVDFFIAHNPFFADALKRLLPNRTDDIYYLPYGIRLPEKINEVNTTGTLKIIMIARMQQSKGVLDVPAIVELLEKKEIPFELTMTGDGPEKKKLQLLFQQKKNIRFSAPATPLLLIDEIIRHDIFLLPSYLDGMPVSLMETMSCGLVPVISDFNEGIKQIVDIEKGFVLQKGNHEAFASVIAALHNNRQLLVRLRNNSLAFAREQFDIVARSKKYYQLFGTFRQLKKRTRYKFIRYGKWIDHPLVPGWIFKNFYRLKSVVARIKK